MAKIGIIDYGMGNIGSIVNMLKKIGATAIVSNREEELKNVEKLILPGVGAFDHGMENIKDLGLDSVLEQFVLVERKLILGLCLGMQLLTHKSEEGVLSGLGWLDAETVRFTFDSNAKKNRVPHMGWNNVSVQISHPLLKNLVNPRFYFVHSYYVVCNNPELVYGTTEYGGISFASVIGNDNVFGVQFHPEKSHHFGMQLLTNFVEM